MSKKKTTILISVLALSGLLTAPAAAADFQTTLPWEPDHSVESNYIKAENKAKRYCRQEASKTGQSHAFKREFVRDCVGDLMDSYVTQVKQSDLAAYHEFDRKPIKTVRAFAQNPQN